MNMEMRGKNVVVTGAAGGLGSAIAMTLSRQGAGIAVLDVNKDGAQAIVDKIAAAGGKAVPIIGDLTTRDGAHGLFRKAVESFGEIHGLVNNAGIYPRRPIFEITDDEWNASLSVNVRGLYHMT